MSAFPGQLYKGTPAQILATMAFTDKEVLFINTDDGEKLYRKKSNGTVEVVAGGVGGMVLIGGHDFTVNSGAGTGFPSPYADQMKGYAYIATSSGVIFGTAIEVESGELVIALQDNPTPDTTATGWSISQINVVPTNAYEDVARGVTTELPQVNALQAAIQTQAAAGANQAAATELQLLTASSIVVTSDDDTKGVKLMSSSAGAGIASGKSFKFKSDTQNKTFLLYPATGGNIGLGVNTPRRIFPGEIVEVSLVTPGTNSWGVSVYPDEGSSYVRPSSSSGVVAFAGGGQADATLLQSGKNKVDTVATAADSVKFPKAFKGFWATVINNGANAMDLFPASGDNIEGLADDIAISVPPGTKVEVFCYDDSILTVE